MKGPEARLLAEALHLRDEAQRVMLEQRQLGQSMSPEAVAAAEAFVHEERIVNRLVSGARDE